MTAGQLPGSDP